jgi:curved DNA-binding protein CbpA
LGVHSNSDEKQIKIAYHKLAKKHHPDLNEGKTSEAFKEMSAAYDILSDSNKKIKYDEMRGISRSNTNPSDYYNHSNETYNKYKADEFYANSQFKSKYSFKDPKTGEWKTYYSSSAGNPFFNDINEMFRKMNEQRRGGKGEYKSNEEYYDQFKSEKNDNFHEEYDENTNNKYNFKYNYYEDILYERQRKMNRKLLITFFGIFLVFGIRNRAKTKIRKNEEELYQPNHQTEFVHPLYNNGPNIRARGVVEPRFTTNDGMNRAKGYIEPQYIPNDNLKTRRINDQNYTHNNDYRMR